MPLWARNRISVRWSTLTALVLCAAFWLAPLTCVLHCQFLVALHAAHSTGGGPSGDPLADDFVCVFGSAHQNQAPAAPHRPLPYQVPMALVVAQAILILLAPLRRSRAVALIAPPTQCARPPLRPPIRRYA